MSIALRDRAYVIDELGDPDAPVGTRPWCLAVANEIRKAIYDGNQVSQRLLNLTLSFKQNQAWQELGWLTWEEFCDRYLQYPATAVDAKLDARAVVVARGNNGKPNPTLGTNQHNGGSDNCKTLAHGNSAEYLTARIARDRPDILERMQRGEYKSVRSAAIEAGIIKPKQRLTLPDDPRKAGKYLAERIDQDWLMTLIDSYFNHCPPSDNTED